MRDQFILELQDGPIRQVLKLQLRRDPALTFEVVRTESLALERDTREAGEPTDCMAVSSMCPAPDPTPTTDWKRELRKEIMKEVKEQMGELSKSLLSELRAKPTPRALTP